MRNWWCLWIAAGLTLPLQAQTLSGISSRWSDSFVEWDLYATSSAGPDSSEAPEEELYGELKLRWLSLRDDWSEWDFRLGDERGTIKMKWKDDPGQWELRTYSGTIITMKTAWNNDLSEWRITNNDISLTLRSRWTSQTDEWLVQDGTHGTYYLYTRHEGDPRDWIIEDRLDEAISRPMKLAIIFLTVFHSTPRL